MSHELILKEHNIEIEIGSSFFDVSFTRTSKVTKDSNFGADADGRRGEPVEFIEDDYAESIYVDNLALEEYDTEFQVKVRAEVDNWLNENEAEIDNL